LALVENVSWISLLYLKRVLLATTEEVSNKPIGFEIFVGYLIKRKLKAAINILASLVTARRQLTNVNELGLFLTVMPLHHLCIKLSLQQLYTAAWYRT
jgi:hypothetical protein